MRVLRNVWFFVLVTVTTEVSTNRTPTNGVEKAIKSLVTTMGNKFDKLIAAVKVISQGKPTVKPGKFCVDHYEKDWRTLLASSTVGELSLSRIGLRHHRAYRREELFFRLELVGKSLALTIFLPSFLCLFLNVLLSFSFWQESPLSRARKFWRQPLSQEQ